MSDKPKKMNLKSMDISEEKREKLKELFPEMFSEGHIDFDQLKRVLGEWVEPERERFGLNWPGKAECMKIIQAPAKGTLRPCKKESISWDTTENLFIEGDNLEILKLLQKAYFGKVKMIYIDPPYNTGKEFIYPDKYSEGLDTYLRYTGQKDSNGHEFSTNSDINGRFHSRWLNMMYPRLYLAKNLLREDGVVFISIDDNEQANLKKLCDEIFGEENFIDTIVWKKKYGGGAKEKYLVSVHEYTLIYAKNKINFPEILVEFEEKRARKFYKYKDENFEKLGYYRTHPLEAVKSVDIRKNLIFPITAPDGTKIYPNKQWRWSKERVREAISKNEILFNKSKDEKWVLYSKQYLNDENGERRKTKPQSIIDNIFTQDGTKEIIGLFKDDKIFPFPKPVKLLKKLIEIGCSSNNDMIMDFFAGSATTAHATLQMNAEDGGNRKFIMIQLPEICLEKSEAFKSGYKNVADIGKERIRKAIKAIKDKNSNSLDLGFKALKLDKSCFKEWNGDPNMSQQMLLKQIEEQIDYLDPKASNEDILYELILKDGLSLTAPIDKLDIQGKTVYSIENGALLICLDRELTEDFILKLADILPIPKRVICLDAGFRNNDQLKTNAVHIFKTKAHHQETTIDFHTV